MGPVWHGMAPPGLRFCALEELLAAAAAPALCNTACERTLAQPLGMEHCTNPRLPSHLPRPFWRGAVWLPLRSATRPRCCARWHLWWCCPCWA